MLARLVSDLKPHTDKHGLRVIFATESEDGSMIYDVSEAKTMEGAQAFLSDPPRGYEDEEGGRSRYRQSRDDC